jgi:hypothetical protein
VRLVSQAMSEFQFDPPLTLRGNIVVLTLDDAVAFTRSYTTPRMPAIRDSVLRWLERANDEGQQRKSAADMFRVWANKEGLLLKDPG